ncbi:glycoside hydrolase family 31 protein [Nocardioides rubriscoriae]|uniref:glycoside hydrolase family 31 protein n=1 Tax=Nocardioides rubriscoriae TaxID=642762 RepID=UPI0014787B70|nr:glycoside hydrolase family 31 protein [Nocardioides rubriscoriae]
MGPLGAFPAVGFVVGRALEATWPLPLFTGNRILGAEAGAVVSLVEVTGARRTVSGWDLTVRTDAPAVSEATVRVRALPGGGVDLAVRPPPGLPVASTITTLRTPRTEGLYGLGARKDAFDQRGLLRNVWVEQQNATDERAEPVTCPTTGCDVTFPNGPQAAYLVQPSVHGSRGWTAWFGATTLSRVDLAASRGNRLRWGVASAGLDLHLAGGGLVRSALAHTADVGRAPAPPSWIYQPWVDVINQGEGEAAPNGGGFTGGARVKSDLRTIVRRSRELRLPLGVLGVEGWQEVPDGSDFFHGLRQRGYHLAAYWNPFHSPGNTGYDEAERRDLFIEGPTGEPYAFVNNRGALTYAIDWTKPGATAFWQAQLRRSMRLGFEGWMHDFGEFVGEEMRFADGTPPEVMHNRYPVLLHRAADAAATSYARTHRGFQPFFYVRSGFDGTQRSTGAVFPGDETSDWAEGSGLPSVVPAMLNLALGGFPTFTTDVGGYFDFLAPRTTPELMTRWSQLAALTPVMRVHNSTANGQLDPHELTGPHLDAYRRYARLKVRLAPMVDRLTRAAADGRGLGPVRPLVLADPSPAARSIDDQWLLGPNLLVAPVLEPGARTRVLYLPRGRWVPVRVDARGRLVREGRARPGSRSITVHVRLADIPLFVRSASARRLGIDSR